MDNRIKITKDLKIDFKDLMREVDQSQEFTLRDILTICVNSHIPIRMLEEILQCPYLLDYYNEANSKPSDEESHIEYLELYWWGSKSCFDGIREDSNFWSFHGVGKKGYVPEDILEHGGLTEAEKVDFIEHMAVEFSPMYNLADFPVRICKKLHLTDYEVENVNNCDSKIDFQPSIMLIEVLYWIFWELSFCGSIEERDGQSKKLQDMIQNFDKAKEDGTLKLIPHEQVKERIEKKINDIQNQKYREEQEWEG